MRMWKAFKTEDEADTFKSYLLAHNGRVCMSFRNMRDFEKEMYFEPHTMDVYKVVLVYRYDN